MKTQPPYKGTPTVRDIRSLDTFDLTRGVEVIYTDAPPAQQAAFDALFEIVQSTLAVLAVVLALRGFTEAELCQWRAFAQADDRYLHRAEWKARYGVDTENL